MTRLIPLLIILPMLAACGQRDLPTDRPLEDGSLFYRNEAMKFSLILPSSFENYQTQRTEGSGYTDIEFFVPTSDTRFGKRVGGYGEPIVIRVFDEKTWNEVNQDANSEYKLITKKDDKVFTVLFWSLEPKDWQGKWSDETEAKILEGFKAE